jgi:hypothetical protein
MKSKITIDADYDNQPVVRIDGTQSDDVRDKLVMKFLQDFGGQSCWASFAFRGDSSEGKTAIIRPILPTSTDLEKEARMMLNQARKAKEREESGSMYKSGCGPNRVVAVTESSLIYDTFWTVLAAYELANPGSNLVGGVSGGVYIGKGKNSKSKGSWELDISYGDLQSTAGFVIEENEGGDDYYITNSGPAIHRLTEFFWKTFEKISPPAVGRRK